MSTTTSTTTKLPDTSVATPTVAVRYQDGMVVTADDLDTAMRYPVSLLRTILRAHFGCGVVCGFELSKNEVGEGASRKICISPGAAVDCNGHPIELCKSVELDFSLDPCTEFGGREGLHRHQADHVERAAPGPLCPRHRRRALPVQPDPGARPGQGVLRERTDQRVLP